MVPYLHVSSLISLIEVTGGIKGTLLDPGVFLILVKIEVQGNHTVLIGDIKSVSPHTTPSG
jgi:hypothetical protein